MALTHEIKIEYKGRAEAEKNLEVLIIAKKIGEQLAELSTLCNCSIADLTNPNGLISFHANQHLTKLLKPIQ